jgi:hypothetical protein
MGISDKCHDMTLSIRMTIDRLVLARDRASAPVELPVLVTDQPSRPWIWTG